MMIRITSHLRGGCIALAVLCAVPAVAQDAATEAEPLTRALTALSVANDFEVRGLDKVGNETVTPPKAATPVQALKRILDGYAYTLELTHAEGAGKTAGKLVRVSILGHVGDTPAVGPAQPAAPATTVAAQPDAGPDAANASDSDNTGSAVHPVAHMLRSLARSIMPATGRSGAMMAQSGQPAMVAAVGGASATAAGSVSAATAATNGGSATNVVDMAAFTRAASANLSALVQSLKAACPAGGRC